MSLIKQLWLAVIALMLIAFGISFAISTHTAKTYLEEQLYLKNIDNATSLALSMNQLPKDPTLVELQLLAQFDNGHYQRIQLTDASGHVMVERTALHQKTQAPHWFSQLINIQVPAGTGTVMDGWNVYGTITLESQTSYAYDTLWQSTRELLIIFALAIIISGLLGSWILKLITHPLNNVVEQAEALGERRFITHQEPKTREFKQLVRSMNRLSTRIKTMLATEAQRLEQLRQKLQQDHLTGLFNRETFMSHVNDALHSEDHDQSGYLLLARVTPLSEINQVLGHQQTDQLLLSVAQVFKHYTAQHTYWKASRLNGSDFALLITDSQTDTIAIAHQLQTAFNHAQQHHQQILGHIAIAISDYHQGESLGQLMARTDEALANSEHNHYQPEQLFTHQQTKQYHGLSAWRQALTDALAAPALHFQLGRFSVRDRQAHLLHYESPLRLHLFGELQTAGIVFPWIARLNWQDQVDLAVAQIAIETIKTQAIPLCINISAQTLTSNRFREGIVQGLRELSAEQNALLWLDIAEHGAYQYLDDFRSFCLLLKPYACKIGLEHAGEQFARIAELNDLGLDYYKLNQSFIHGINQEHQHQSFVQGVITVAHAIGLTVIAEGVQNEAEQQTLMQLGIDAMTGPAIT